MSEGRELTDIIKMLQVGLANSIAHEIEMVSTENEETAASDVERAYWRGRTDATRIIHTLLGSGLAWAIVRPQTADLLSDYDHNVIQALAFMARKSKGNELPAAQAADQIHAAIQLADIGSESLQSWIAPVVAAINEHAADVQMAIEHRARIDTRLDTMAEWIHQQDKTKRSQ